MIYYTGAISLAVISIISMVYITKMVFLDKCNTNNATEKNIMKGGVITIWMLIAWIISGAIIQELTGNSVMK